MEATEAEQLLVEATEAEQLWPQRLNTLSHRGLTLLATKAGHLNFFMKICTLEFSTKFLLKNFN